MKTDKKNLNLILLARVRLDGGTQPRVEMDLDLIDEYAEHLASLPPVLVMFDGKHHWLCDGYHRLKAHQKAGKKEILAEVRKGTRREAILLSLGVNAEHGLRRTNADIRRAVETMLKDDEWSQWPDEKVAAACAVTRQTVIRHRQRLRGETNKGQNGVVTVLQSATPMLPEEWAYAYDALTPEAKQTYLEERRADVLREQAKAALRSWRERVEAACRKLAELFVGRPEVAARDRKVVEQRLGTILKTAQKYE